MREPDPTQPDEDFDEGPSKTQVKKAMQALQDVGAQLVALSRDRLAKVPMPDNLRSAIQEAQRITSHGARRRQMQYIGKLMRTVDAEPIEAALEAFAGNSREEIARQHRIEQLRDDLIADEKVLHRVAEMWPDADLQQLRVFRRNAIKEREAGKPPRAYRELFRALRDLDAAASGGAEETDQEDMHDFE